MTADEAEGALVAAGQKFLGVAQRDGGDARALGNWGRALCLRAELAPDPQVLPVQACPLAKRTHALCSCALA